MIVTARTIIIKFPDKGGVVVLLMSTEPLTVFITPTKTRDDLIIRCAAMQNYCNEWFESGRGVHTLAEDLIYPNKEDVSEWVYRGMKYYNFTDVIGKALIACYEALTKEAI